MTVPIVEAYTSALRAMEGKGPKRLVRRAEFEVEDLEPAVDVSEARLREHLSVHDHNDELNQNLHLSLAQWDSARTADHPWTEGTSPNTDERRALVITLLDLTAETGQYFAELFPVAEGDATVVITGPWDPWYTPEIQRQRDFYWGHYINYLRARRGWKPDALTQLDLATTHVVEKLTDPTRREAKQRKGLVVGYVQSGKTANFTGVIAKSIDAGYRLIIVLTGTTNLLREQTQRRLDMELVGRENVLRGINEDDPIDAQRIDYLDDEDWVGDRFVRHRVQPAEVGRPDIRRMTNRRFDYRRLQQGLPALEFERRDHTKPLWHQDNLFTSNARLVIVKKNSSVLNNLIKDLRNNADRLMDIPVLIIDDESDQASINTTDPRKWIEEKKKRTAINKHLSALLEMLPRAQYVGYTATPFANVFVDPTDPFDIFPSDFLISLKRPDGYMGAEDFHDLDRSMPQSEKTFADSQERAHVRLVGEHDEDSELRTALDCFVMAGAIKLFRQQHGEYAFRHHTMLVHETSRTAGQRSRADSIKDLWATGGYLTGGALGRLRNVFDSDFGPVMEALSTGDPRPADFDDLKPFVGQAARVIAPGNNPVLVVNSDKDIEQEDLDFDKRAVWRVLVGGNKLARGFTVEGLTVTYYSRNVGHAEALMQMGRWFGFRRGYRDLVRLFITSDVKDEFEAACRDEQQFRSELRQYAEVADGRPLVTPYDIPPLVMRHGLRPTAANKMYNAQLVERRTPNKEPGSGYPNLKEQGALTANLEACRPLLQAANEITTLTGGKLTFEALTGSITHKQMVEVLQKLTWSPADHFKPDLAWIKSLQEDVVDRWAVIFPQQKTGVRVNLQDAGKFSIHGRLVKDGMIRGNSEPAHRLGVKDLPGQTETTARVLVYPVRDKLDNEPLPQDGMPPGVVMALRLELPAKAVPSDHRPLVYQVVVPGKPLYAIVDR
jgi:hypothetical protein